MPLSQAREVSGVDRVPLVATVSGIVIAANPSFAYRVLCYTSLSAGDGTLKFSSGGTTDLTGDMPVGTNGGISTTLNALGHFQTLPGESLNVVLGGSATGQGHLTIERIKQFDR